MNSDEDDRNSVPLLPGSGEEDVDMKRSAEDSGDEDETGASAHAAAAPTPPSSNRNLGDPARAVVERRIESFFYQLLNGCGRASCSNPDCRSSGMTGEMSPNDAALRAVQCVKLGAILCRRDEQQRAEESPSKPAAKMTKTSPTPPGSHPSTSCALREDPPSFTASSSQPSSTPAPVSMSSSTNSSSFASSTPREVVYLTEATLATLVEDCVQNDDFTPFIRKIGRVFSSSDGMNRSFLKEEIYRSPSFASKSLVENPETNFKNGSTNLDIPSVRRAFQILQKVPEDVYVSPLTNILMLLFDAVELELKFRKVLEQDPNYLNLFLIVMEMPMLPKEEFSTTVLPALCKAAAQLPLIGQAGLARIWSRFEAGKLRAYVQMIQNYLTHRVITGNYDSHFGVNDDDNIVSPTCLMKILYYASLYGAPRDIPTTLPPEAVATAGGPVSSADLQSSAADGPTAASDDLFGEDLFGGHASTSSALFPGSKKEGNPLDQLAIELEVQAIDVRDPLVQFADFYNEPLSEAVEMDKDYSYFREDHHRFSFMNYSFVLTPSVKALGLFYDSRIRMHAVRRMNLIQSTISGTASQPYLKITVRRDNLIEDALNELEMVSMQDPGDLRKQLVVEFVNEQGVDEGGVSKEFFQLIVESLFNPDFAMFTTDPETKVAWFNPTSFESDRQYTLIGIIFGLAIYNNVILNVNFPRVVYKKLMGRRGTFHDLKDYNPTLYQSLCDLLASKDDDMESSFMVNFRVGYKDVFDNPLWHDLVEDGENIFVNKENRLEFVERYADFILNGCIASQFRAFKRGFNMVTEESPLNLLFRPDEVELLVCGSKEYNFDALEDSTEYDQGYTASSQTVRDFWSVVHNDMDEEAKRKLLQFTTGSDRVPMGGMSQLKLIIAKHGPNSDRLPTAHTCFNVLLLPDYQDREKLKERLFKAISYSQGFGML
ncbi:unnamed protein product [Cyprideis torosa]|uniref:HECT-type E3 ubiquitin transferase n=1 Tax=Cyprideis torosa TaxID=163714 RepID=A0A7R8W490_9CRUS|nr:unnamed protein product [Cyprideis torosa]CAG0881653.1 unnamed protein product [Cyprideis torosa]